MAKPVDPRAPGARDIPVESVRGKEEPDGEEPELGKPLSREPSARSPQALKTSGTLTTRERLFLAGLVVLAVAGGALYLFRSEIAAQYELRFEPARYWRAELGRRQFGFKMGVIQIEECHADLPRCQHEGTGDGCSQCDLATGATVTQRSNERAT